MSKSRIGLFMQNVAVAILLSGMAIGLTACAEKGEASSVHDGADNHTSGGHLGGGMGMP